MIDPPRPASHDSGTPPELLAFMTQSWAAPSGPVPSLAGRAHFAARRAALSQQFPGEVLIVATGHEKVRSNDTNYRFRPGTDFYYLTGDHEADVVLVMVPSGGAHRAILFTEPNPGKTDATFFTDRAKGELWVGPRLGVEQTAERFGVLDPFDPRQNITGGVKYLRWLMDTFKGDLTKVIAAYNSGENNVIKYQGIPPFAETRAYVPRVLRLFTNRLVKADPRAAGSMALLQKGRGGFQVDEKALAAGTAPVPEATPVAMAENVRPHTSRIFQWVDATGRIQISDQPPPKGASSVKVFD